MNAVLCQDILYAFRSFRRSPGFVAVALITLALGIGANTAIFSVVNAVLLQPLSYPDPDRIVQLTLRDPGGEATTLSVPEFMNFRAKTDVFQDVAAYDFGGPGVNLTDGDRPEQVRGIHVSLNYFRLFGAQPQLGRTFVAGEDRPGGGRFVVISHGLWRRRFGADSGIVGRAISLGNEPYIVVGVLGARFNPDPAADLWLPLQADPNDRSQAHYIRVAARLSPGITLDGAKARLQTAAAEFRRDFPLFNPKATFSAWPLRETLVGDIQKALLILLGTVGLVLLIACANVANLLLARASGRRREIAIRIAMGASRARIVSQLLTESVLLSAAGGVLGLIVGQFGMRILMAVQPGNIPRMSADGSAAVLDGSVLLFAAGISAATGILCGILPALGASHADLSAVMKDGSSRSGSGRRENTARSIFVVAEVALALVLLVGAALLIRTFAALRAVQPGFDAHHVLTLEMSLNGTRFQRTAGVNAVVREVERRLGSLPGVSAAASSWMLPIESAFGSSFNIEGRPLADGPVHGAALMRPVSSQYFDVFRIPLLRGRTFTDADSAVAPGVVLISEGMAKKFWPGGDPIGERLSIDKFLPDFAAPPRQIIGIVGDVHNFRVDRDPDPMMYLPQAQVADGMTAVDTRVIPITWVIRTKGDPYLLAAPIQEELRKASGGLPVAHIRSMEQVLGQSLARSDFNTVLLAVFAGVALLLSVIGVYGLVSYSVQQRSHEIGVRMALGATPQQVRGEVICRGMRLAIAGVGLGVAAALGLARVMASLVFGVKTSDPLVFAVASIVLCGATLAASYVPSRRATKIDPVRALRCE